MHPGRWGRPASPPRTAVNAQPWNHCEARTPNVQPCLRSRVRGVGEFAAGPRGGRALRSPTWVPNRVKIPGGPRTELSSRKHLVMFVSPHKFTRWKLTPSVMVLGGVTFGRCSGRRADP